MEQQASEAVSKEGAQPSATKKPRFGVVSRALGTTFFLAVSGLILITVFGRPETVAFSASFKCSRFAPGSPINLSFEKCSELRFRAPILSFSRDAYQSVVTKADTSQPKKDDGMLDVGVEGDGPITASLEGDYHRSAYVKFGKDGLVELLPSTTGNGEFRVSSESLDLSLGAWGFSFKTPSDGSFSGFGDGISDDLLPELTVNKYEDEQGGVPEMVEVTVPQVYGPVSIRGAKDEVAGWTPITFKATPSEKPLALTKGALWAEKVSSCALSVNREPIDLEAPMDRLQIETTKASITSLKLYQDAADGYISVEVSGIARSIKQNNKEIVESVVSRLLSQPSYKTGLTGFILVFVVFAGGIFLKRALEVLAELWLPKDK